MPKAREKPYDRKHLTPVKLEKLAGLKPADTEFNRRAAEYSKVQNNLASGVRYRARQKNGL